MIRGTASQTSDVGSIPIARSIIPDDSIAFTRTSCWKPALKWPVLDRRWPEAVPIGPNVCRFGLGGWRLRDASWTLRTERFDLGACAQI